MQKYQNLPLEEVLQKTDWEDIFHTPGWLLKGRSNPHPPDLSYWDALLLVLLFSSAVLNWTPTLLHIQTDTHQRRHDGQSLIWSKLNLWSKINLV